MPEIENSKKCSTKQFLVLLFQTYFVLQNYFEMQELVIVLYFI